MKGNVKEILDTLEAVQKTADEVRELLKKSMPTPPPAPMAKDEDQVPAEGAPAPEATPEAVPAEGAPAPEATPEAVPAEGAPAEGGEQDEMAQEIASMSDEELGSLLQVLAAEMDKRKAAAPAPEATPEAAAPAPAPEMDAMKSENMEMKKSIQFLQTEIASLKKSLTAPAARPAVMNKPQVQNKVEPKVEMLNKSEVLSHLESLKKSGNRMVDTDLIWKANSARSEEDIAAVYHDAKVRGIVIPSKK